MIKKVFIFILATFLFGLISCTSEKDKHHLITVKVREGVHNPSLNAEQGCVMDYSRSMLFSYLSNSEGQISLPVFEHDLLAVFEHINSDYVAFYEYCLNDGTELEFLINDSITTLNGKVIAYNYDGSHESDSKLESMSDNEIRQLRYLNFYFDSVSTDLSQVDRVARINPHIGIWAEGTSIVMALEKFSPKFLYAEIEKTSSTEIVEKICSTESIECLVIPSANAKDLNMILNLPHLRQLIIQCLDDFDTSQALIENSTLEMLSMNVEICDFNISNLNFLVNLNGLKHLTVIGSETLNDISGLQGFIKLKSLNLIGDTAVSELSSLKDLHSLESFYFPYNISQQEFNDFISDHQELNFISLTGCENVSDLSPLLNLKNLKFLILSPVDSSFTAESLKGFSSLKYLSIGPVEEEDSTMIPEIKAILPNTIVNENTGLCMGSGYLLLVVPLFLFISVISMVYRKRFS